MPVVLGVLLGVSLVALVPLVVDKVWRCKEEERVMAQADWAIWIYYPDYTNTHWECIKKEKNGGDWEDARINVLLFIPLWAFTGRRRRPTGR